MDEKIVFREKKFPIRKLMDGKICPQILKRFKWNI
jgi:hypothetical protein